MSEFQKMFDKIASIEKALTTERGISDKLEKALKEIIDMSPDLCEYDKTAVLAEVAAIRVKQESS